MRGDVKTYFFTSYARGADRAWVGRFHTDLEREVRVRRGLFAEGWLAEAGGADVHGAAESAAMVALISADYLRDPHCGREWAIFEERLATHRPARDLCLIPVRWRPIDAADVPTIMRPMPEAWTAAAIEPATRAGVLELMRTHRLDGEDGYYAVVRAIAARVFDAESAGLAPLDPAAAAATGPAFGVRSADRTTEPVAVRAEADDPPRTVAISYVGADLPWAEYLGNLLRTYDYDVELVRWNAGRSEPLRVSVDRARGSGERVVAVLSQNYVAPHMEALVREEDLGWEEALTAPPGSGVPVIPVQVDSGPLPGGLSKRAIRMHGLSDAVIRTFLDAVRRRPA
ncbi:TIR domain-containing protein [Actinomadura meyerae]|uniref:TIR domain-containing protein n=1 Tax=Actinomadura meyerae TaxID=240840 RepID=A0A239NGG8_9ACTN|nr:toll/interleukin-1 receptor domain-containing protein [Actinomadura meyerae]SNT53996.1 TIR domain-containing protein [Actinomadura meyerae]